MTPSPEAISSPAKRKPRLALAIATGFGLGYLPKAPGTWGSLGGLALVWFVFELLSNGKAPFSLSWTPGEHLGLLLVVAALVAAVGVWAAGRCAAYLEAKDPQVVVIDEVSGQLMTLVGGPTVGHLFWRMSLAEADRVPTPLMPINWKYFLLGFILFRVFDIWKPFPVRQAENLPGGWGIMADDWMAALYAALGLWGAGRLGL